MLRACANYSFVINWVHREGRSVPERQRTATARSPNAPLHRSSCLYTCVITLVQPLSLCIWILFRKVRCCVGGYVTRLVRCEQLVPDATTEVSVLTDISVWGRVEKYVLIWEPRLAASSAAAGSNRVVDGPFWSSRSPRAQTIPTSWVHPPVVSNPGHWW